MTRRVDAVETGTLITEAAKLMNSLGRGALVVVDKSGKIIGIVTERDIVRAVANGMISGHVDDIMTRDIKGVSEDVDVDYALNVMLEHGFRHLPVLGKDGKVKGIVSIRDLARGIVSEHFRLYGKNAMDYQTTGVVCPVCEHEIDEFGYCGCGTGSG